MSYSSLPPRITSFLVKIASRCNLACDYCYIYEHADQTWRAQPAFMSDDTRRTLAIRIGEYVRAVDLKRLVVVFHGGEPLLAGAERISETAAWIREALPSEAQVDFSLQTNGTLLTEAALTCLKESGVSVALSLDGPKIANDLHRVGHHGESSFEKTLRALELLERHPETYGGLIAVIDPLTRPEELFEFFAPRRPPRLDFLLPDANHQRPPAGREYNSELYKTWLLRAFDLWFTEYPTLPVRMFDAVLGSIAGIPSDTDAFGFGDVTLLSVETDGSYHDLDVLKITAEGMTALGSDLWSQSIVEAIKSPQMAAHRQLLTKEGLSEKCLQCPEVDVCGGGSVPHRYSSEGFRNPTVYCEEMLALIGHARIRMQAAVQLEKVEMKPRPVELPSPIELLMWERPETSHSTLEKMLDDWAAEARPGFERVLNYIWDNHPQCRKPVESIRIATAKRVNKVLVEPATVLWTTVMSQYIRGITVRSIDGNPITADPSYVHEIAAELMRSDAQYPRIHHRNVWLELPFGKRIAFEDEADSGTALIRKAFQIIESWRPSLAAEIRLLDPDVQFIRDLDAHPDKAVSFSDNSTPGALYLCIRLAGGFIDPYLLADSLIHEHRHQKLYLLQRAVPLVEADRPLVPSPWREDLRPPSGLFHAIFVFVHLSEYWQHLADYAPTTAIRARARDELAIIRERIESAIPTLRGTRLTGTGVELLDILESEFRGTLSAVAGGL